MGNNHPFPQKIPQGMKNSEQVIGKDLSFYAETTWESKLNGAVGKLDVNGMLSNIRPPLSQNQPP